MDPNRDIAWNITEDIAVEDAGSTAEPEVASVNLSVSKNQPFNAIGNANNNNDDSFIRSSAAGARFPSHDRHPMDNHDVGNNNHFARGHSGNVRSQTNEAKDYNRRNQDNGPRGRPFAVSNDFNDTSRNTQDVRGTNFDARSSNYDARRSHNEPFRTSSFDARFDGDSSRDHSNSRGANQPSTRRLDDDRNMSWGTPVEQVTGPTSSGWASSEDTKPVTSTPSRSEPSIQQKMQHTSSSHDAHSQTMSGSREPANRGHNARSFRTDLDDDMRNPSWDIPDNDGSQLLVQTQKPSIHEPAADQGPSVHSSSTIVEEPKKTLESSSEQAFKPVPQEEKRLSSEQAFKSSSQEASNIEPSNLTTKPEESSSSCRYPQQRTQDQTRDARSSNNDRRNLSWDIVEEPSATEPTDNKTQTCEFPKESKPSKTKSTNEPQRDAISSDITKIEALGDAPKPVYNDDNIVDDIRLGDRRKSGSSALQLSEEHAPTSEKKPSIAVRNGMVSGSKTAASSATSLPSSLRKAPNGPLQQVVVVGNVEGKISLLNDIAKQYNARAIIHTGNFGFYDSQSVSSLPESALKHVAARDLGSEAVNKMDREQISQAVLEKGLLSDFMDFVENKKHLEAPVYVIWGQYEDLNVIEKVRKGLYHIPNLYIIDHRTSHAISTGNITLRLFGLGGSYSYDKLFDVGSGSQFVAGGEGKIWANLIQMGELLELADHYEDQTELRIFVTQASPSKEPLAHFIAAQLKADYTISSCVDGRICSIFSDFVIHTPSSLTAHLQNTKDDIKSLWDQVYFAAHDKFRYLTERRF